MSARKVPPMAPTPGICRYCQCTESHACLIDIPGQHAVPCSWADMEHTMCTAPACVKQHLESSLGQRHVADALKKRGGA